MFAITHKITGKFFAGFSGNDIMWADRIECARHMPLNAASGQAILFARTDDGIQQKPVKVPA